MRSRSATSPQSSRCVKENLPHSTQRGIRHRVQPRLRRFRESGEDHGNMIAGVFISGAGNDDTGAVELAAIGCQQRQCHFSPGRKGSWTTEFDTAFVNHDCVCRKGKARLPRFDCYMLLLKRTVAANISCAHKCTLKVT